MNKLKGIFTSLFLLTLTMSVNAQESKIGEFMRSKQRSYVVIAVMLTILAGLILYIVRLDRKISKLEK